MEGARPEVRRNAAGEPVITYVPEVGIIRPWATRVEVVGPDPVDLILAELGGWALSCSVDLGQELLDRGATLARRGHRMTRDLAADPPPASWARLKPLPPFRIVRCDRPAETLLDAWRAAYPPNHPDHFTGDDPAALRVRLIPLLSGRLHGPVLPISSLVTAGDDGVVAAVVVNQVRGDASWGGPWITELFRIPGSAHRGLGTLLLRRTLALAAGAGLPSVSLVVTDTNPARHLYQRNGFQPTHSFLTVIIPAR